MTTKEKAAKKDATEADKILAGQSITMSDGTQFVPGDEELLAEVLTAEQAEHLKKHRVIQGFNDQPTAEKAKAAGEKSAAAAKAGGPKVSPTLAGMTSRGNAAEPLSATVGLGASELSSDEVAAALGGGGTGAPPPTARGASAPSATSSSSGDFDPNKATMAELSEKLGASGASVKGTGSNGQVTKKDLLKAYKKANG